MMCVHVNDDDRALMDVEPDPGAMAQLVLSPSVLVTLVSDELEVTLHAVARRTVGKWVKRQSFPGLNNRVALHRQHVDSSLASVGCSKQELVLVAPQWAVDRRIFRRHPSAPGITHGLEFIHPIEFLVRCVAGGNRFRC